MSTILGAVEVADSTLASMEAADAITNRRFVKINTTNAARINAIAATTDPPAGLITRGSLVIGQISDVISAGIAYAEAGAAITPGQLLKVDSVGRVVPITTSPAGGDRVAGVALGPAIASGDYCLMRICAGTAYGTSIGVAAMASKTADYQIVAADVGTVFDNTGAGGTVVLSLPDPGVPGQVFTFTRNVAFALRIKPGAADGIYSGGAKKADTKYLELAAIGNCVTLLANAAGDWITISQFGTPNYEA